MLGRDSCYSHSDRITPKPRQASTRDPGGSQFAYYVQYLPRMLAQNRERLLLQYARITVN